MKKTERSKPSAGRTSRASYRRHPMSLVQRIAVTASAVITFAILVALLAIFFLDALDSVRNVILKQAHCAAKLSNTVVISDKGIVRVDVILTFLFLRQVICRL